MTKFCCCNINFKKRWRKPPQQQGSRKITNANYESNPEKNKNSILPYVTIDLHCLTPQIGWQFGKPPATRSGSSLLRAHWRPAVSRNELFLHGVAFRKGLGGATSRKTARFFVKGSLNICIQICIYIYIYSYGCFLKWWVSPKSSILIGFSIINHPFWGTTILGHPHMYTYTFRSICMCPYHKDKGNPQSTTKKIEIST